MNKEKLINEIKKYHPYYAESGYEYEANKLIETITDEKLIEFANEYLDNRTINDYEYGQYSINLLMSANKYGYIEAIADLNKNMNNKHYISIRKIL